LVQNKVARFFVAHRVYIYGFSAISVTVQVCK